MSKTFRVSRARFAALWESPTSTAVIAAELGCCSATVINAARGFGLPRRKIGPKIVVNTARIAELYRFGIEIKRIAANMGIHWQTVNRVIDRLALPKRGRGFNAKRQRPTVADFNAAAHAQAWRATAAREQAQMILAEMADTVDNRMVGAAKVMAS